MIGLELSPQSAWVQPYRTAMFHARANRGAQLAGVLVGARSDPDEPWAPAIDTITVEAVIVHGISLHIGPWQDLIEDGDVGWPLFGAGGVAPGQMLVVYVRNDTPELRELRVVLALLTTAATAANAARSASTRRRSRCGARSR